MLPRQNQRRMAQADRLRGHPLQELRGRLDADRQGRGRADNLLARPRAGPGRYDQLRPLRAETRGVEDGRAAAGVGASLIVQERQRGFAGLIRRKD